MPYYKWQGITLHGVMARGRLFAWSQEHLDEQLFKRKIALLQCRSVYSWRSLARVRLTDKMSIFQQLLVLVKAGVLLPDALTIVAEQTHQRALEHVMHAIASRVQQGESVSAVMQEYPLLCDFLMIQLLSVGEQSGTVSMALDAIVHYLRAKHDFYTQVSAAFFVPGITLCFFLVVVSLIFTFIIPRFADLFASLGQDLPPLTKTMMAVSDYLLSWSFLWILTGFFAVVIGLRLCVKNKLGAYWWQRFLMYIPYLGTLLAYRQWSYFFESISLLLEGGIQLMQALCAVQRTVVRNSPFYDTIETIIEHVKQGNAFSNSLSMLDDSIVSADIVSIVRVGQEVGMLDTMLKQVATIYQNRMKSMFATIAMLIQPTLIIMLGLLILLLIIAIYTPILHMSYAV